MTPEEFNKTATQVQLEVFEKYFDDLNQQLRIPQADTDYADRQENIDEKIAIFKTLGTALYDNTTLIDNPYFDLPSVDMYAEVVSFYRLGNVVHNDETIVQRLDRHDFYYVNKSKLTRPTVINPVYLYENNKIFIKPNSINSGIKIDYVRKPKDVVWAYGTGTLGQYEFQKDDSTNFELQESEQSDVILKILVYAGIIIRDPQIVQTAAALVQADETNKKS
tara:strand:- start:5055 stop:5717 length:663 start_codon:yes stop_codon:yes gene_type:complete